MAAAGAAILACRWWSAPAALTSLIWGSRVVSEALPDIPGRRGLASRLAGRGLGWSLRQESALLLRHWWPLTLVACLFSRTVRRMVLAALVVDTAVAARESDIRPATLLGRRLDDLAYGAGLWLGALSSGSLRCLTPRLVRRGTAVIRDIGAQHAGEAFGVWCWLISGVVSRGTAMPEEFV